MKWLTVLALLLPGLAFAQADPGEAARFAGALPEGADPIEHAVWVAVSRVLLNLDEFITRE